MEVDVKVMVSVKGILKSVSVCFVVIYLITSCNVGDEVGEEMLDFTGVKPSIKSEELQSTSQGEQSWGEYEGEKITLDWYINYSWFMTPWGENLVSKTITEETGVSVNFVVPNCNEVAKLNSLIASDTLTDLITLAWTNEQIEEMIASNMIYALDELADDYDIYWYQVANPTIVEWFTKEDGHIYEYPNYSLTPTDYATNEGIASNQTFLVRKDVYEAIGSPDMTTPDGFKAAVKAAVDFSPEIEGEPIIPIGAHEFSAKGNQSFDELLANFLAIPFEKDGDYYDRYIDDELVRWLKVFRELGEQGYLSSDIFIDKKIQMEEKISQGRYFCMLYQSNDLESQQKELYNKNEDSIYIAIDGPKNSKLEDYKLPGMGMNGWTVTMISKNCERPDRAIEFLSYLMSEHGQHMTWLGVEGITWDYVNGVETMHRDVKQVLETNRIEFDITYGADATYWMLSDQMKRDTWEKDEAEFLYQMKSWTYPYVMNPSPYEIILHPYSQESNVQNKINKEWGRLLPQLLLAETEKEFDKLWHEFILKRDVWGVSQVIRKKTELMNEAKEKLEVK